MGPFTSQHSMFSGSGLRLRPPDADGGYEYAEYADINGVVLHPGVR